MIRDLRADEVVRDGKSFAPAGGADVILSTSNSTKSMVDSIQGLRPDGRLVTMGADVEPLSVSLMDLISKRISTTAPSFLPGVSARFGSSSRHV
jgi:alcohol dehydrogenase